MAQLVKNPSASDETWVRSLGWVDPLEKGKATHSSILAQRIPRTILWSMGLQRVGHDWVTFTFTYNQRLYLWFPHVPPNCVHLLSCFSHVKLWDPIDCSPPVSSVVGISQVRILEWIAMPFSRGSSWSKDWNHISFIFCIGRQVLYH